MDSNTERGGMGVETTGFGTKCGCETVREVANGAKNGLWDEKRALKNEIGSENEVAAREVENEGKLALFVVVEYKI